MVQIVKLTFFEIGTQRENLPPQINLQPKMGFFYTLLTVFSFLIILNRAFLPAEASLIREKRHFPAIQTELPKLALPTKTDKTLTNVQAPSKTPGQFAYL